MRRIGIIGSRQFPKPEMVQAFVGTLLADDTVITGGCHGVDTWAAQAARDRGLQVEEHPVETKPSMKPWEFTEAAYARNKRIADTSDELHAFTDQPKGGSWNTIAWARRRGIRVIRHTSNGEVTMLQNYTANHAKRAGLGVFAVHRGSNYAQTCLIPERKDQDPVGLGREIADDFLRFLEAFPLGYLAAIVPSPRSCRHLDRPHPIEEACKFMSLALRIPTVVAFRPTTKESRGRKADHPDLELTPAAREIRKQPVLLIDDVATTCQTMAQAMTALIQAQAHPRGLIWIML